VSATKTFLLELHCEEIPARFLNPLTEEFGTACTAWANAQGLGNARPETSFSPRKLAWRVQGLPYSQPDQTETQVGPPQRMCVGEDGQPTIQGLKFAEKWGVDFSAVRFEQPAPW